MTGETVILAYSGGLDTSCILKWLLEKGYKVVAYMANVGQDEDFEAAKEKARKIGATEIVIEDIREDFVNNYIFPAIQMGLIYEQRYLLGTSLARPCISVGLINCAKRYGAKYISHGATGKGNDQVRFELSCYALYPIVKIIAPWRMQEFTDRFQGRQDLIKYATENNIPVPVTPKAPWSMDANIMHISYESGILENPANAPPEEMFQMTKSPLKAPNVPFKLSIYFEKGVPMNVKTFDGQEFKKPLEMFNFLNKIGGEYAIGRIDVVENRFIGLKSRGVYETPAGTILHTAHTDLEIYCLDKEVLRIKKDLQERMSNFVYNGFWFSPESYYAKKCLIMSQESVTGTVFLELYKGNVFVLGRTAKVALYNEDLVSMDKHAEFSPADSTGFINIHGIRLKEYYRFIEQSYKH